MKIRRININRERVKALTGALILATNITACGSIKEGTNEENNFFANMGHNIETFFEKFGTENADAIWVYRNKEYTNNFYPEEDVARIRSLNQEGAALLGIKDQNNNDFIPNVTVTIKDKDGNVVESYISGVSAHTLYGLKPNEVYIVELDNLPDEYRKSAKYNFTIANKTEIGGENDILYPKNHDVSEYYYYQLIYIGVEKTKDKFNWNNNRGRVQVSAFGDSDYISGVEFEIYDVEGNVIDNWTSTASYHEAYNLPYGEYTLEIKEVPEEYSFKFSTEFSDENLTRRETPSNVYAFEVSEDDKLNIFTFYYKKTNENIKSSNLSNEQYTRKYI